DSFIVPRPLTRPRTSILDGPPVSTTASFDWHYEAGAHPTMPMTWPQDYDPLHAWAVSTLVSALPVVTPFFALIVLRTRVWVAALAGFLMAVVLALAVFGMPGAMVAAAGGLGVIFGMLRIAWVIFASIFLYQIAVETGQFQVMKDSIA